MSKIYADTVEPSDLASDKHLTIGTSGGTVTVGGNDVRANTVKDKSGATLWTSDGSGNLSSMAGGFSGNMELVSTSTITSSVAAVEITGFDNTAELWIVRWYEVDTDTQSHLEWNASATSTSPYTYDKNKTSTHWHIYVKQDGSSSSSSFGTNHRVDSSTSGYVRLSPHLDNESDSASYGELCIFRPSADGGHIAFSTAATQQNGSPDYIENDLSSATFHAGGSGAMTAIRIRIDSGSLTGGVFRLFKLTNS